MTTPYWPSRGLAMTCERRAMASIFSAMADEGALRPHVAMGLNSGDVVPLCSVHQEGGCRKAQGGGLGDVATSDL